MNTRQLDPVAILALIQRFVGPDPDALDRMRTQLEAEITAAEAQQERAKAALAAVEELQAVLEHERVPAGQQRMPGTEPPVPPVAHVRPAGAPSLRNAIHIVLKEHRGSGLTRDELMVELERR